MKKNILIIFSCSCVIAIAGGFFAGQLKKSAREDFNAISFLKADIAELEKKQKVLKDQSKAKADLEPKKVAALKDVLPKSPEVDNLLIQIQFMCARNGVAAKKFSVEQGNDRSSSAAISIQEGIDDKVSILPAQNAGELKNFSELNFSIDIEGTYPSIKSFIKDLESNVRIMDVVEASLSAKSGKGSEDAPDLGVLSARVKIKTYFKP